MESLPAVQLAIIRCYCTNFVCITTASTLKFEKKINKLSPSAESTPPIRNEMEEAAKYRKKVVILRGPPLHDVM